MLIGRPVQSIMFSDHLLLYRPIDLFPPMCPCMMSFSKQLLVSMIRPYWLSVSLSLCPFKRLFSRWTWVSQYQNVSILDFIIAKGYRGDGNSWSHKPAKLQSKCHTNKPTSKFLQARFPDFYISLHCAVIVSLCPTFSESIHLFSAVFKKFSEVLSHQPALLSRSQSYYTHY